VYASSGVTPLTAACSDGRYIAVLFSVAMPIVALIRLPFCLASAPCDRMPLGKYSRLPSGESIANTSGAAACSFSFNALASGL
jgi:hypothetical protein